MYMYIVCALIQFYFCLNCIVSFCLTMKCVINIKLLFNMTYRINCSFISETFPGSLSLSAVFFTFQFLSWNNHIIKRLRFNSYQNILNVDRFWKLRICYAYKCMHWNLRTGTIDLQYLHFFEKSTAMKGRIWYEIFCVRNQHNVIT